MLESSNIRSFRGAPHHATPRPPIKFRSTGSIVSSAQARVVLNGKHFLLGAHGTRPTHAKSARLLAGWVATGRQFPAAGAIDMTVATVIKRFWDHAKVYYRHADGSPTSEV